MIWMIYLFNWWTMLSLVFLFTWLQASGEGYKADLGKWTNHYKSASWYVLICALVAYPWMQYGNYVLSDWIAYAVFVMANRGLWQGYWVNTVRGKDPKDLGIEDNGGPGPEDALTDRILYWLGPKIREVLRAATIAVYIICILKPLDNFFHETVNQISATAFLAWPKS